MPRSTFLALVAAVFCLLSHAEAQAYPWMIRHEYPACAQCHADPSGGGPLTPYGRAMGEVLLHTHYGVRSEDEEVEPGPGAKFLFGAVPLPEGLDFGGSLRTMAMIQKVDDLALSRRVFLMQSDLQASLQLERWVAGASLGYADKGGLEAAITRRTTTNVVSRYHWLGYRLDEDAKLLVRGGRMNLPFGIRDVQHTLWVRAATRSDIDDAQQHGVALSYSGDGLRGELMAIAGNFQIRPDVFRETGGSGYLEWAPTPRAAVGVSTRLAYVARDPRALVPVFRHAHGLFARWAPPVVPLVVLAEADYVVDSFEDRPRNQGIVAMAQLDLEPVQGLHYQLTGETQDFGPHGSSPSFGLWASFAWFFASHVDLRLDGLYQSISSTAGATPVETLLIQLHGYL